MWDSVGGSCDVSWKWTKYVGKCFRGLSQNVGTVRTLKLMSTGLYKSNVERFT